MALPKRKISSSRGRKRRTHQKLHVRSIPKSAKKRSGAQSAKFFCPNCKQVKPSHAMCPNCGYYRGRMAATLEKR
ncbi:MAG TPA: 50S ribosomal protein L32 [Candidatus Brocadiia bacterium]|nr:50S ribosomal protein L32 [Candidatus Brocadiia bacterium]